MFSVICLLVFLAGSVFSDDCQKGIVEYGVGENEKNFIVDKHNEVRRLIAKGLVEGQPKGTNLKKLHWDDGLARAAQDIANTCIFAHVSVTDDRWSWVGQNLYQASGWSSGGPGGVPDGSDWESGIMPWFNEHETYVYPNDGGEAGHYTQVVWADTQYVGCGYTNYVRDDDWKAKYYVCNYGPGGNYIGQAPYQTGDSTECDDLC